MRLRLVAGLLALLVTLAGCQDPGGRTGPTDTTADTATTEPPDPVAAPPDCTGAAAPPETATGPPFDGDSTLRLAEGLLRRDDGTARHRVPGTDGHQEAACWLHVAMSLPGWNVTWESFTGAEYRDLDHGAVSGHADPDRCTDDDIDTLESTVFWNLVAHHDTASERQMLLGAHWDAKAHADQDSDRGARGSPVPGANDGASGVVLLLQLMRHIAAGDLDPRVDVGVVLFDGEDGFDDCHPLAGSLWHVQQGGGGDTQRFLLLDMVGDLDARFVRESRSLQADPDLVDLVWDLGRSHGGQEQFTDQERSVLDDHVPFIEAGIPAVDLIDFGRDTGFPPYWHTTEDDLDVLDAEMLGLVGRVVWDLLESERLEATWP